MINKQYSMVMEDCAGYPLCSIVGNLTFCLESLKVTLEEQLKNYRQKERVCIESGFIRFTRGYATYVHDNDVMQNVTKSVRLNSRMSIKNLLEYDVGSKELAVAEEKFFKDVQLKMCDIVEELKQFEYKVETVEENESK